MRKSNDIWHFFCFEVVICLYMMPEKTKMELVLAVARYVFELTVNNLLNNLMKSIQDLRTDLGLRIGDIPLYIVDSWFILRCNSD